MGYVGAESSTPGTRQFVPGVNATLEKKLLHVALREEKTVVKVDRVRVVSSYLRNRLFLEYCPYKANPRAASRRV